ncbi:MAG: pilin [Patescibacteria group bacterium]
MFCAFVPVLAADDAQTPAVGDAQTSCPDGACTLTNPLGISTPQAFIGRVVNSVMGLVGSIALVMFVYGGLTWMTSSGSEEKVKKGRDILVWSAVGLVVVFMAYALTRFVLNVIV